MAENIAPKIAIEHWRYPGQYVLKVGEENVAELLIRDGNLKVRALDGREMIIYPGMNSVTIDFGSEELIDPPVDRARFEEIKEAIRKA